MILLKWNSNTRFWSDTEKKCDCGECQFCAIFVFIIPFCAVAKQFITADKRQQLDYHS